jgi:CheY-like chemotaxis protein
MAKKVLIVDDDESIVEVVQMILEGEGYQVDASLNGDCIPEFPGGLPDLILLDVLLLGEDGREICQQLKRDPGKAHIPVIMLSAYSDANKFIGVSGADGFIEKPFDVDVLITIVAKYLAEVKPADPEVEKAIG